ncbi:MAG TPA: hypothetical protein PK308_01550 [Phycisphaerales bacterium]|nr:hypothetical protein [Phycisphaerales bacterium]
MNSDERGEDRARLGRAWRAAAGNAEVGAALMEIYARCEAAVRERGPACWASGRCCNFERAGHRLYVTGLEAAWTVLRVEAERSGGSGRTGDEARGGGVSLPVLSGAAIDAARASGGCPFQRANLCGVHGVRPLGCRVYFCDRSAQQWQQDLYEGLLREVRAVHDRFGIEYRYGEWRSMLETISADPDRVS